MIGISTSAGQRHYWHLWLDKNNYKIVEIDLRHTYFPFYEFVINHVKESVKNYDLSMHSTTEALFSENEVVRKAHQCILMAEIDIAEKIGARQIVFHAPKFIDLEGLKQQEDNVKFLQDVSKSAKEKGIQLLMEYPTKGPFTEKEVLKEVLKMFPDILMCLDVGHLVKVKNSIKEEKQLVNELSEKIVYLHINDSGDEEKTEHGDFGEKKEHYIELLAHIRETCPIKKAIIEINDEEIAKSIHNSIKHIFNPS